MSDDADGRIVEVKTKFHREAIKPGGVSRSGARMAADRSVSDIRAQVEQQIDAKAGPLTELLRRWPGDAAQGCAWAGAIRDLAGLADRHLLTEVAMHTFDCLDAVVVDGASLSGVEAACYADALAFARHNSSRGQDLAPYGALLKDLEVLTTLVIERKAGSAG
jgi:hypothetical protein